MKLTKISARNFKGLDFDLDLTAGVVLVGANFAGKSARIDAIRLLLLGHLPELGRTPRAAFELSSGRSMGVYGTLEDGREIWRTWTAKGDSVKSDAGGFDGILEDDEIDHLLVMLDASTYFSLSPNERVAYVFENLPASGIPSQAELVAEIRAALKDADETAVETLVVEVDSSIVGIARKDPRDYLEQFLALTHERSKAKRAEGVRFEKTVQGLAQLRLADPGAKSSASWDAEILEGTKARDELVARKAALLASYEPMIVARKRRAALEKEVAGAAGLVAEAEGIRREINGIEVEAATVSRTRDAECPDLEAAREKLSAARMDVTLHETDVRGVAARLEKDRSSLEALASATTCPYCGADGDGWKALKRAELESSIADLEGRRDELEEALRGAKTSASAWAALVARALAAGERLGVLASKRDALSRRAGTIDVALSRIGALKAELEALPADDPELEAKVETTQTALNVKNDELRRAEDARAKARARELEVSRLSDAEKARDEAVAAREVADLALEAVRAVKAALVEKIFAPLLRDANALFPGILRTALAYHDAEIGTWRSGAWVSHRVFSGTEKALAYAAIQLALASKSPFRILLLDELGRLDDDNALKVDAAIANALNRGTIEQFVGIDAGRAALHRKALTTGTGDDLVSLFNVVEVR